MRIHRALQLAACIAAALMAMSTPAAAFGDDNWPCMQRKVLHLSWGQMWTGPALPETPEWRDDPQLRSLVPLIAARRTPLDRVEAEVAGLSATGDTTREERLVQLFAGAFDQIDRERTRIVEGIERYASKQLALSEYIDRQRLEIAALEADVASDDYDTLDRIDELTDKLDWDTRIYDERRQSLTYVCESPVLLEKRAFSIARIIQGQLEG